MKRRTLLAGFVKATGLAVAGIVGIPALINAFSPVIERRRDEVWRPVGELADFEIGTVSPAVVDVPRPRDPARSLGEKTVFVWRPDGEETVVFSQKCTDLSCSVIWDPGSEWFFCPCHGGIFAKNGERKAGPPQRPLYRFANRIEDDVLHIDLNSLPPNI